MAAIPAATTTILTIMTTTITTMIAMTSTVLKTTATTMLQIAYPIILLSTMFQIFQYILRIK